MLEWLIRTLVSDEIATIDDLARRMSISPGLLEQMLQDLARGGYIESVNMDCDCSCQGCEENGVCALVQGKRIWRVTDKGFRLAGRPTAATGAA